MSTLTHEDMLLDIFDQVVLKQSKSNPCSKCKSSQIFTSQNTMSTLHHEDMLLQIFDEVCEAFPYLDEEKQIEIANNRFQDLCQ